MDFHRGETVGISALFCIFVATNRVIGLLVQDWPCETSTYKSLESL